MKKDEKIINGKDDSVVLVWVHGSGGNKEFLYPTAEQVTEYKSVLIDLAGHGESDNRENNFDAFIKTVKAKILGYDKVVLIGHSLGGMVTLKTLSENIPNVIAGIGISTGACFKNVIDKDFLQKITDGVLDMDFLMSGCGNMDNPDVQRSFALGESPEIMLQDFKTGIIVDIRNEVHKIKVPLLMLVGEDDTVTPKECAEFIKEKVGDNCSLKIYKGFKHMLPLANKEEVAKDIVTFVKNNI